MKIQIAYSPEESTQARAVAAMVRHLLGKVKVKVTDQHKPFRHIYIATRDSPATGTASQAATRKDIQKP